jgi:hypothetical protein
MVAAAAKVHRPANVATWITAQDRCIAIDASAVEKSQRKHRVKGIAASRSLVTCLLPFEKFAEEFQRA